MSFGQEILLLFNCLKCHQISSHCTLGGNFANKLKSIKMHCNVTIWGLCWPCFSKVAFLDFRLKSSAYPEETSTRTQSDIQLLAICMPSHVLISNKFWNNAVSLVLPHSTNSCYSLTAQTRTRMVSFTEIWNIIPKWQSHYNANSHPGNSEHPLHFVLAYGNWRLPIFWKTLRQVVPNPVWSPQIGLVNYISHPVWKCRYTVIMKISLIFLPFLSSSY